MGTPPTAVCTLPLFRRFRLMSDSMWNSSSLSCASTVSRAAAVGMVTNSHPRPESGPGSRRSATERVLASDTRVTAVLVDLETMTKNFLRRFVADDTAQDLVEYALLLACVALGTVAGLRSLGSGINSRYGDIATAISTAAPSAATPGAPAPSAPAASVPAASTPAASGGGSGNNGNNGNNGNHGNRNNGQGQGGQKR
jgi:pilus assembly protein Flp/PilA